jgi:hypothetical protein
MIGFIGDMERHAQTRVAMLKDDGDRVTPCFPRRQETHGHAEKRMQRQIEAHVDAAHSARKEHAFAVDLDHAHMTVCGFVVSRETDRQAARVEPHAAARPGGQAFACRDLTPQSTLPRRNIFLFPAWEKHSTNLAGFA